MTSLSFSLFFFWWLSAPLTPEVAAKDKYLLARRAYLNQNWKEAKTLFEETLTLLAQAKGSTDRQRDLFTIGRSDVRFHLAQIADQEKDVFGACRQYATIRKRVEQLPAGWEGWPINTKLPERFAISKRRLQECRLVPSLVSWNITPPNAIVERWVVPTSAAKPSPTDAAPSARRDAAPPARRDAAPVTPPPPKVEEKPTWKVVTSPLKHLAGPLRLRIRAEGFLPQEKTIQVLAWEKMQLVFALKPKPRERKIAIVRRPVKPVRPKGTPTWVWITVAAGVVVVGGAVAIGVYAATRPLERVNVSFR